MYPILLDFSGHRLSSWLLMALIAFWAAFFVVKVDLERREIPSWQLYLLMGGCLLSWFSGAHIGHLLTVGSGSTKIGLQVQVSGLMLYGGLIGVLIFGLGFWFLIGWNRKLTIQELWDVAALPFVWVFFFGRIGCTLYGCCFGTPSGSWPGYVLNEAHWDPAISFPVSLRGIPLHPAPLYEALGCLWIIGLLNWMRAQEEKQPGKFPVGVTGWICWIHYGVFRFLLEYIRMDARGTLFLGLSPSQWISIVIVSFGVCLLPLEFKKGTLPLYRKRYLKK